MLPCQCEDIYLLIQSKNSTIVKFVIILFPSLHSKYITYKQHKAALILSAVQHLGFVVYGWTESQPMAKFCESSRLGDKNPTFHKKIQHDFRLGGQKS